jgi:hypothetical protein
MEGEVLMKKYKFALMVLIVAYRPGTAQLDTLGFFQKVNTLYYSVESTGLQNFSLWVTSDYYRQKTDSTISAHEYPWELIWIRPNKMFFIRRPLPGPLGTDSAQYRLAQQLQLEMQQELKGVTIDWQRFYGGRILADLPARYDLMVQQDTITLNYETLENGQKIRVAFYFGQNGLCFKLCLTYLESGQEIFIYPAFTYLGSQWLCSGWQVQILDKNEVQSGFIVQIFSEKSESYWFPKKIIMQLQTKSTMAAIYKREYYLANLMVNRSIKLLE